MKTISKLIIGSFIAGSLLSFTIPAKAQRIGHMAGFGRTAFYGHSDALRIHTGGFYHPYFYPRVGIFVRTLPVGYYSFVWNTYPYYYYDGLFYQSASSGNYTIAEPPVGAVVPTLPVGAEVRSINGTPYYEYSGVFYESFINSQGKVAYKIVGKDGVLNTNGTANAVPARMGDITDQLPGGSHRVTLSGKTYWVTPDEVYLEEVRKDNVTSYRVVGMPESQKDMPAATQVKSM